jgi:hypothetical protein
LGTLISELVICYDAFGYAPRLAEPPDHIAVEIGFVAFLKLKEAYARAMGDHDHAGIAARAAAAFIADHLATMAEPLAQILASSPLPYLASASRLLAARVGPRPRSGRLPMLSPALVDEDDGGQFTCAAD